MKTRLTLAAGLLLAAAPFAGTSHATACSPTFAQVCQTTFGTVCPINLWTQAVCRSVQ